MLSLFERAQAHYGFLPFEQRRLRNDGNWLYWAYDRGWYSPGPDGFFPGDLNREICGLAGVPFASRA